MKHSTPPKTKDDLLRIMLRHSACDDATDYVKSHPSSRASVIGGTCDERGWLIWLLGHERRLARFVTVCARRAKGSRDADAAYAADAADAAYAYAADAADAAADAYAAAYAAADAAYAAAYADADAADAAADAADAADAERAKQLVGLQRIWREWCAGKPAESALPF